LSFSEEFGVGTKNINTDDPTRLKLVILCFFEEITQLQEKQNVDATVYTYTLLY